MSEEVNNIKQSAEAAAEQAKHVAGDAAEHVKEFAGDAAEHVKEFAGDAAEHVKEFLSGDVAEKAKDLAGDVAGNAKEIVGDVAENAKGLGSKIAGFFKGGKYSTPRRRLPDLLWLENGADTQNLLRVGPVSVTKKVRKGRGPTSPRGMPRCSEQSRPRPSRHRWRVPP
ncbi:uncharacterized protein ECU03_1610 [Arthrobacter sp. Hiyo1]|uniref:hypothetical protein n=1 Tax=Arthrobacter sp. Hiyo1 TaxID=1588020 RepID=UPI0006A3C051|nr:hypothetical protein [Arthrobacter sp. Hiyo1]GAP58981.1 uncharacterized protein ECU03_1610 [Arthrobacter sp. Hiyo1]